ncbi:PREDICTED: amiloride-sensitive amine oxidase [copper-containing] [Myotis davidii]|uniref:amiloride-sensitive amine oxidase [copper-containing] n=1 Tax=Myotis davidii TaxID=225400 RepID=UPI0007674323|nr:PREDICTED: amiloride-sensitive amine oxidase [copper-containing] [Myotis davidii]
MRRESPALSWAVAAVLMLQTLAMANHSPQTLGSQAGVFADLSTEELKAVRSFLWSRKDLRLEPSQGSTIAKNTVFLIEMLLPRKQQVLKFLDHGQRRPAREARAIIFFGAQEHPNITEFAVGPLPRPHYLRTLPPRPGHQMSWTSRPISSAEYVQLSHTLEEATRPLHQFFLDTTGFSFQDCHTRCLTFTDVAPRGLASGERRTWFILQRFVEGFFLHPTGLEWRTQCKMGGGVLWVLDPHSASPFTPAGTKNSFQTLGMKLENITNPWSPEHRLVQPTLEQTGYSRERQAAFRFGRTLPKYLLFTSPKENRWGHQRSYWLQIHSMAEQVLPPGWQEERAFTWDLVAWVTVGFLHIPHSEDIPNTATPGNSVGFLLRPFNFFTEDPSVASRDTVIVWPRDKGPNYVQRWIPEEGGDCWKPTPFSYNGTYRPV